MTPLGALTRGLVAGLAGTAAMTAWQEVVARLDGSGSDGEARSWEDAPAPAQVAKRILEGVFHQEVSAEHIPLLTQATHWSYGTAWGAVYGLVQSTFRPNPVAHGAAFGTGVWATSYLVLVPMGLYERPWAYPAKTVAKDISYHLAYGLATAAAFEAAG